MQLSSSIDIYRLDGTRMVKTAQAVIDNIILQGAKAWLKQIDQRIPTRTGFLRGAFRNAEEALGYRMKRQMATNRYREYYKRTVRKTWAKGTQYATKAGNVIKKSKDGDVVTFQYNVSIIYWAIMDRSSRGGTSPWEAMRAANQSLDEYVRSSLEKRMPDMYEFFNITKSTLRGRTISVQGVKNAKNKPIVPRPKGRRIRGA